MRWPATRHPYRTRAVMACAPCARVRQSEATWRPTLLGGQHKTPSAELARLYMNDLCMSADVGAMLA